MRRQLTHAAANGAAAGAVPTRRIGLLPPMAVWLAGLAVFTTLSVETLLVEDDVVFLAARLTAYLTGALVGAAMLAFAALFGLGCGVMLRWLDNTASGRLVARSLAESLWLLAAYMWVGVALLVVWPPTPLSALDLLHGSGLQARFEQEAAFLWVTRLRHVALGGFLALCVWRLAHHVKWLDAALAVGCGAGVVGALLAGLGALAGSLPAA